MATMFDIHTFHGPQSGPRLLVLGAVHGNETCGTVAIGRVLDELAKGELRVVRGSLTLIPVTNRLAYERGARAGDRNLNRNLAPTATPQDNEDRIANELCPVLAQHDVLLDLHSFHSPGEPFVMVGPYDNKGSLEPFSHAAEEEALAACLGVTRAVDGWLDTYARGASRRGGSARYGMGTTEYMRSVGGYGVTLECGQHEDPRAPGVAYGAIHRALAQLQLIDAPAPQRVPDIQTLRLVEVVDRADPGDRFAREWKSFEPVRAGETIGLRANGEAVTAPADGFVVFPNTKAERGAEWFYFAQQVERL
ncbi:succinylglutamate desuccinylase/aspartoacylase domain-containing protein [Ramlibacter albus]|uniref:Succinylglutamate desuccinylase/aspartoacylase family protein n=1 Tax=Ramlibacter albus TaxID=2079448 RepID=A0A923S4Z4_9BURK|nr:succinylglutamate desuccinylase/aspartoacylase family protein [Ramlibacter albus]MBC5768035.1 succinylglutamate desuccinylase/aspartoacylase family protein [Ramlibacter albus]